MEQATTVQSALTTSEAPAPKPMWKVFMPCVVMRRDGSESGYTQFHYYVAAETKDEAEKIAESWLPKHYDLDDSASAVPWTPDKALIAKRIKADEEAAKKRRLFRQQQESRQPWTKNRD